MVFRNQAPEFFHRNGSGLYSYTSSGIIDAAYFLDPTVSGICQYPFVRFVQEKMFQTLFH